RATGPGVADRRGQEGVNVHDTRVRPSHGMTWDQRVKGPGTSGYRNPAPGSPPRAGHPPLGCSGNAPHPGGPMLTFVIVGAVGLVVLLVSVVFDDLLDIADGTVSGASLGAGAVGFGAIGAIVTANGLPTV